MHSEPLMKKTRQGLLQRAKSRSVGMEVYRHRDIAQFLLNFMTDLLKRANLKKRLCLRLRLRRTGPPPYAFSFEHFFYIKKYL